MPSPQPGTITSEGGGRSQAAGDEPAAGGGQQPAGAMAHPVGESGSGSLGGRFTDLIANGLD